MIFTSAILTIDLGKFNDEIGTATVSAFSDSGLSVKGRNGSAIASSKFNQTADEESAPRFEKGIGKSLTLNCQQTKFLLWRPGPHAVSTPCEPSRASRQTKSRRSTLHQSR
jgi:hypothetical protein